MQQPAGVGPASDMPAERLGLLRDALAREDLDALLITAIPNIRYLTGFSGSSAIVLVTAADCVLLTDFRYAVQVGSEVSAVVQVRIETSSLWDGLWDALGHFVPQGRVGFESAALTHADFTRLLHHGSRWQWRPCTGLVEDLRTRKDPGELAAIERAVEIAETALTETLAALRPGLTETQVAGVLERNLREAGSESYPFETIVASGERSALPHARPGSRRLELGDFVLLDFGAVWGGYCSDITRTFVLGVANDLQREIYAIVLEANERASGALRAGIAGNAADRVAREYIDARGFGEAFGHSLGHGIGLEVHEAPRLARTAENLLASGMVVTIEPGIYRAGWGGVRIEDDVVVEDTGARVLTRFPRALCEIV